MSTGESGAGAETTLGADVCSLVNLRHREEDIIWKIRTELKKYLFKIGGLLNNLAYDFDRLRFSSPDRIVEGLSVSFEYKVPLMFRGGQVENESALPQCQGQK